MNKSLIEKLSKKNILAIDDDRLVTRTLCNLLKREIKNRFIKYGQHCIV